MLFDATCVLGTLHEPGPGGAGVGTPSLDQYCAVMSTRVGLFERSGCSGAVAFWMAREDGRKREQDLGRNSVACFSCLQLKSSYP